jgi:NADH-quinone oxidoreductase subunit G
MIYNVVNIEIDGKQVEAENGAMLIEAADNAGIHIPRFCYHRKLSVAANCRMCLVEIEKARKPMPACATPVVEGMKVFTKSPAALAAQKGTMEFLLINHPLDCPICDQGGECELQDVAMGYGEDVSRYAETKRVVKDKNIGPLIATDMTRCIHCTRCVRFGEEIAGLREMGATGRGEFMEIGTYVAHSVASELSGNVIDLCPVGALTAKPSRYAARAWEMVQRSGVAPHDCLGSNIHVHTRNNEIVRVVPRENEGINECWLSDRDRFSYQAVSSEERLMSPMIRVKGQWQETDWDNALNLTAEALLAAVPDHLAGLCSPGATLEEMYLFQKLLRALGTANIDHRLGQTDFSDQDQMPIFPWLGDSFEEVRESPMCFLIGANIRKEQPLMGHMIRQSVLFGGKAMAINPMDYEYNFDVDAEYIDNPEEMVAFLASVTRRVCEIKGYTPEQSIAPMLDAAEDHDAVDHFASTLTLRNDGNILLGSWAMNSPYAPQLRALASTIADAAGHRFGYLPEGGNAVGGWLAGVVPHRGVAAEKIEHQGMTTADLLDKPLNNYVLFNVEPEHDMVNGAKLINHLKSADFVVAITPYLSDKMRDYADVLLPLSAFTESSGTYVNAEGRWQSVNGCSSATGNSRPGWKILRVLGNLTDKAGFEHVSSEEVREELKSCFSPEYVFNNSYTPASELSLPSEVSEIRSIPHAAIHAVDSTSRRAEALQQTSDAQPVCILGLELADTLGLDDGDRVLLRQSDASISLPVRIDASAPADCVFVPRGVSETSDLADYFGPIDVSKA